MEYRGAFGHFLEDYGDRVFGVARKDLGSVPLVFVTRGAGKDAQHLALDVVPERQERFQQFHGTQGVAHVLYGFQALDVVEEPATACEAEQAELLDFQEAYRLRAHGLVFGFLDGILEELLHAGLVFGCDERLHVVVAGLPRADLGNPLELADKNVVGKLFQVVERVTQGTAPFLVPAGPAAGRATAIAVPAAHAVRAAPCTSFAVEVLEHNLVLRRELLEEPTVVHRHHLVFGSVAVVEPGGAHVAEGLVVTVAFAVGTDAHELRVFAVLVPGVGDAPAERAGIAQEVFEPYGRRKPRVVEEYVQVSVAYEIAVFVPRVHAVGARRIDVGVAAPGPFLVAELAEAIGLRGREDGKLDACLDEFHHRLEVDGGLGEPHGLGHAAEMELEILDTPADLCALVLLACKRHDDVVVDLRNCVAVPEPLDALLVGFLDAAVGIRRVRADPAHEGWAHVETHVLVVVDDIYDMPVRAQNAACGIGTVALARDSVVPVVVWACARLVFDDARPGIFARGLVKMTVNSKVEGVLLVHTPKDRKLYFTRIFWA